MLAEWTTATPKPADLMMDASGDMDEMQQRVKHGKSPTKRVCTDHLLRPPLYTKVTLKR